MYTYIHTYYSCGLGASQELLEERDIKYLPECPHHKTKKCQLSETKGIEVYTTSGFGGT